MNIVDLEIENFKAIKKVSLTNLGDIVVIAGPNGCGKSCILDAIRLVKSCYGGYQPNEWQQWFGEFQINVQGGQTDLGKLFQNSTKSITISVKVELSDQEKAFLALHSPPLIERLIWNSIAPDPNQNTYVRQPAMASSFRTHGDYANERIREFRTAPDSELNQDFLIGKLEITPGLEIHLESCAALELVFSTYDPQNIGVIDYHGAGRNYTREQVGGINLNIATSEQTLSQHALYNYTSKYSNIKTEMASSFVRDLLAREVGVSFSNGSLIDTLQELFATFFPGKQFLGPKPTAGGGITFPVQLDTGEVHDINELSSGEKEVLYGYLRLQSAAPRNSVLLLDEPELHLNPRLIRGLPRFYQKHLGEALGNQIWLITHSDAFLRETVSEPNYSVFHMQPSSRTSEDTNQLHAINATEDVERAVIDLVGDLATYKPGAKIIILEGGGNSEFDLFMTSQLFPDLQLEANVISGGNKKRVREFHELLDKAVETGAIDLEVYSITDKDFDDSVTVSNTRFLTWDAYHIENYLLAPTYLLKVLQESNYRENANLTEADIETRLLSCAQSTLQSLVKEKLATEINSRLVSALNLNIDPNLSSFAPAFYTAATSAHDRLSARLSNELSLNSLEQLEYSVKTELETAIYNGQWKSKFRGRDILKKFTALYGNGIKYEVFRDFVIARMRDANYKPEGIQRVLDSILTPSPNAS
jgi:predicted ATPase